MDTPIENELSQWQLYLTNINSNLLELFEQMEFQLIKARANDTNNGYTGITKVKADKCIHSVWTLWEQNKLLSEVLDKANKLYSKHSFINNTEDEVKELLNSTLVVIEEQHVDINERNLLGGENKEKKGTPKDLLNNMQLTFESICSDIKEISYAEETMQSRLSNIKDEIAKLSYTVKRLGITNIPEFDTKKITKVESDPLQGVMELDKLVYSIEKYRASIMSIEEDYNNIGESFSKVRSMLSELKEVREKSKSIVRESNKIFDLYENVKPIISEEVLNSLEDWLMVLENKLNEGIIKAVKVGVLKLEQECNFKLELERENYYINSKNYMEWLDLKGEFKALVAKFIILKAKGRYLGSVQDELIENTRAALYASKVDLGRCRKLVRNLELTMKD